MKKYWRFDEREDEYGVYACEVFSNEGPGVPVITSEWDGKHYPGLDVDVSCDLYESKTPGHYHLFVHKSMTWRQYKRLLKALAKAGLCEEEWVRCSIRRGFSFLRCKVAPT